MKNLVLFAGLVILAPFVLIYVAAALLWSWWEGRKR